MIRTQNGKDKKTPCKLTNGTRNHNRIQSELTMTVFGISMPAIITVVLPFQANKANTQKITMIGEILKKNK